MTIKRQPDDFKVEELLDPSLRERIRAARATFALYRLTKRSVTTTDAVIQIAGKLRVPRSAINFAGLKDRHAATIQHLSVREPSDLASALPANLQSSSWQLERIGWIEHEFAPNAITGNHFAITVRRLSKPAIESMDQAIELLTTTDNASPARSRTLRIVNYFGDQRFGSARHGRGFVATHLIRGEFEAALKLALATPSRMDRRDTTRSKQALAKHWGRWTQAATTLARSPERRAIEHLASHPADFRGAFAALPYFFQQICVEAYQSHLWNAIARGMIQQHCGESSTIIEADDPFGPMLFPAARETPAELIDLNLPLLGRRTKLIEPWKTAAERVLAGEGLDSVDQLHIPRLKRPFFGESPRRLLIDVPNFTIDAPQRDELDPQQTKWKRQIVMDLPRGAYATVVLRALGE